MLLVNQQDINLGNLKFGNTHHFSYTFTNQYPETVYITSIVEGCKSCTKVSMDKMIVEPSSSATLSVAYTPGSTGVTLRGISIFYKVGNQPAKEVKVTFKSTVT